MRAKEKKELIERARILQGRRRSRFVSEAEVDRMAELDRKRSLDGKEIRIYSYDGFVANAYDYRCMIDYIHRSYDENGKKHFTIGQTDAKRPRGDGALVTVNGRAY